jgi:hypothetical protein
MLLWRLTSIILKIEAPRPAADVRKPERSECPANRLGCWGGLMRASLAKRPPARHCPQEAREAILGCGPGPRQVPLGKRPVPVGGRWQPRMGRGATQRDSRVCS